jgi:NhaA family Na+:H+ antiporter
MVLALCIGKPLGVLLTTWAAAKARIATFPADTAPLAFVGAAFLCGIGDPLSLLMADQAFQSDAYASIAKIGVLAGSAVAAVLGAMALSFSPVPVTAARPVADT